MALTYVFGKMVGGVRQGVALLAVMTLLFGAWLAVGVAAEHGRNPALTAAGLVHQSHGNMMGKEARFGVSNSVLMSVASTQTTTGSVNSAGDSYTPLGGLSLLAGMAQGDVTPGGTGSGLYGMLFVAVIAVFVGGLMVGRTPEYLGKKLQAREMKLAALGVLVMPITVLVLTGIAVVVPSATAAVLNHGPQGFSEIFYAYISQGNGDGSAFAGLSANSAYYNVTGGIDMLLGRYGVIIPALALAGVLAGKGRAETSAGNLSTASPMFVVLVTGVILLVGALTFFPALALGPIVQQFMHGALFP